MMWIYRLLDSLPDILYDSEEKLSNRARFRGKILTITALFVFLAIGDSLVHGDPIGLLLLVLFIPLCWSQKRLVDRERRDA